jgi:putrescine aminotransferase
MSVTEITSTTQKITRDWQKSDHDHYMHPFTDHSDLGQKGSRIITRADGVYIYDSDGNQILDGMAGLWCVNMGYGRQDLVDAATHQMKQLPYYNSFFQTSHPPAIELSELLGEVSPAGFNHTFFTGSGSEANDTVIKLVRRYWDLVEQPSKKIIISRKNAYHGSTVAAGSLGGMSEMHKQTGTLLPGIEHIDQPYYFELGGDLTEDEFGIKQARLLEQKILECGAENVAAFIGEPVQGAGGVIIPPDTYWPEIQRICREYDILLIADEVITGFGRLGEWFGSQRLGIEPDLMPFAKGVTSGYLPLGGVLVGDRVANVVGKTGGEFIKALRDEGIVDRVKNDTGPYFKQQFAKLADHPIVGEARSIGMVAAIELVKDKQSNERFHKDLGASSICRDFLFSNGLVMRPVGQSMIVSPPLVFEHQHVDELVEKAWKCLDLTAASLNSG